MNSKFAIAVVMVLSLWLGWAIAGVFYEERMETYRQRIHLLNDQVEASRSYPQGAQK